MNKQYNEWVFYWGIRKLLVYRNQMQVIDLLPDSTTFYLFMAALGLRCCLRAFSSCGKQGLYFI